MNITHYQSRELVKHIRRLIEAEVADAWKGAQDPADAPIIEQELQLARLDLAVFIDGLQGNPRTSPEQLLKLLKGK